jgi:methionine synthase II (cobalamin-independent)
VTLLDGVVLPATGVGSLPGDDPLEACKLVFGELPDLPHLPELPGRGPGADMLGRTAGLLTDLWVDLQPSGWRFVPREGVDSRRASDLLARDMDALEEVADGWQGPLKIQAAGPWTLAAGIELPRGDRALADPGAVRDIAESLADGLARHAAEIRRRISGVTTLLVQLDEPSLPAALAGHLPTASGFDVLPAVEGSTALDGLRAVLSAVGGDGVRVGVHCCASDVPIRLLTEAGAGFLGVDIALLRARDDDPLGEAIDAGVGILLGAVPTVTWVPESPAGGPKVSDVGRTVEAVRSLWRRVGFGAERMREIAAVTPTCGLAGAPYGGARGALRVCREAAKALSEEGS